MGRILIRSLLSWPNSLRTWQTWQQELCVYDRIRLGHSTDGRGRAV
jgi:hypothetical protein